MCATRSAQDDWWTWNCWFYARFVAKVRPWVVSLLHFCRGGEKFRGLPFTHRWLTLVEGYTRQKTNRAKSPQIMYCHRGRARSSFRISPIRYMMVIFIQNGLFCYFVLRPTRQCWRQIKKALADWCCQGRVNRSNRSRWKVQEDARQPKQQWVRQLCKGKTFEKVKIRGLGWVC